MKGLGKRVFVIWILVSGRRVSAKSRTPQETVRFGCWGLGCWL